jgi:hypothetical protein
MSHSSLARFAWLSVFAAIAALIALNVAAPPA